MSYPVPWVFTVAGVSPESVRSASGPSELAYHRADNMWSLELPPSLGSGTIRTYALRSGMLLHIADLTPCVPVQLQWQLDAEPLLEFHLHLAGEYQTQFAQTRAEYLVGTNSLCTTLLPGIASSGQITCASGVRQLQVEITLLADELERDANPWCALAPASGGATTQPSFQVAALSPAMRTAALQLVQCPFEHAARQLYLESKALEILALALDATAPDAARPPAPLPHDVQQMYAARDILIAHLDAPPSLVELARRVNVSDFKLKQGFRQVFNTTVFGYLYQERMQRAYHLLLAGELSVLDVALRVGYRCPGRFSAAFRRMYGCTPSAVQNGRRTASVTAHMPSASA